MGRPKRGDEARVLVSTRIPASTANEIDVISTTFFAKRTLVLEKIIIFGLEEFKKENADMMKLIEKRNKDREQFLTEKKRHAS